MIGGSAIEPGQTRRHLLRDRNFLLFFIASITRLLPTQMMAVAVGWQVYAIRHHPFDIGLVGLAEFAPMPLLALPTGQLADRISRKFVIVIALVVALVDAALLLGVTLTDARRVWAFVALGVLSGVSLAIGTPSTRAVVPELVGREDVSAALALRTVANQIGVIAGPAIGGILLAVAPASVYAVAIVAFLVSIACTLEIQIPSRARDTAVGLEHLLGGIAFLRRSNVVLGAILLDLFAVLFGGAVALLPAFARDVLHLGPMGLGVLRSAPAVGAVVGALLLSRHPRTVRAGPRLLIFVALFGLSILVFGLSRWLPLSLFALAVSGFADTFAMNIRSTTVALATPNELRGRVSAVENVFISASNQLGAFESGSAAALLGTVPSVIIGGAATVAVAALWVRVFPALAKLDDLDVLQPDTAS